MPRPIAGLTDAARAAGFTGGWIPTGMIRWRMGNVHVAESDYVVAREFWHRARQHPRPLKRAIVRVALREHRANQRLYRAVMHGRW